MLLLLGRMYASNNRLDSRECVQLRVRGVLQQHGDGRIQRVACCLINCTVIRHRTGSGQVGSMQQSIVERLGTTCAATGYHGVLIDVNVAGDVGKDNAAACSGVCNRPTSFKSLTN